MKPEQVILDTNVWVSLILGAKLEELVGWVTDHHVKVWTSPHLVSELTEVLNRPKFSRYLKLPISEYLDFHKSTTISFTTASIFDLSPDPKDNYLFDLANKPAQT